MPISYYIAGALMGVVFYTDYRYRKIYNPIVLLIFALAVYQHQDVSLLYNLGFVFIIFLPFWATGGLGGGDYKLMMALGTLIGTYNSFLVFIFGALPCIICLGITKFVQNKDVFRAYIRDTTFSLRMVSMGQLTTAVQLSQGESVPLGCWLAVGYYVWMGLMLGGVIF